MTEESREHFLQKIWKRYTWPTKRAGWVYGRFSGWDGEQFLLFKAGQILKLIVRDQIITDSQHGQSLPTALLVQGDVVAVDLQKQALYLLSPCQGESWSEGVSKDRAFSQFLGKVRGYLIEEGFEEVRTPVLVESPGVDHHIDFFKVQGVRTGRQWTLPTSPEIHLKKKLCQGFERIFEIKSCFRDDLDSPIHWPEFTMLEWYQSYQTLDDLAHLLKGLLAHLVASEMPVANRPVTQLFHEILNFRLTPQTSEAELKELAQSIGVEVHPSDDWNDLYFRIFLEKIEPRIKQQGLLLVTDFPPQQASLAQIGAGGWAQRFELFWDGVEIANAYFEVNDPAENERRFQIEGQKRLSSGRTTAPLDPDFFHWMKQGMPPASGVAVGLDRLFLKVHEYLTRNT